MNGSNGHSGGGVAITQFGFDTGLSPLPAYVPGHGNVMSNAGEGGELAEWVRNACQSGIIDTILISRLQNGAGPVPVNRLPCGPLDPDELAARIARVCDMNAKGFGRVASYEIEACVREANALSGYRTVASHILTAGGEQARSRGEVEPPNETGLVSQVMRHKEVDQGLKDKMTLALMDRQAADNRELREELAHYKGVAMELFTRLKEYTILSADEQGRIRRAEIRGGVEKEAISALTQMIPVGLQMLATKFAATESVVFQRLKAFSEGISDEQYGQIAQILKPEQSIQLMEMLGKQNEANMLRQMMMPQTVSAPVTAVPVATPAAQEEKK